MTDKYLPDRTATGLTQDQYRRLCLRAFGNLPSGTQATMDDVDAILAWCLPEYDDMRGVPPMSEPIHWPTFLRELDAAEQTWRQQPVRYPREDAVPWMPYSIPHFVSLLTEAVAASARPRDPMRPEPGALAFLDVGCGPGTKCRLASALFGLAASGVDIVPRFVGEAQAHGVNATVADAFDYFAPLEEGATWPPGCDPVWRYDIILVNRPSGLQDELEGMVMDRMASGAVLIAINWRHDPAKERDWLPQYQEYGEPIVGVFLKP